MKPSSVLLVLASVVLQTIAQRTRIHEFGLDSSLDTTTTTTPVPILRFIDQQNSDGSYTFGYESGDGTYKIETRLANGEVKGKYGYYDDSKHLREVTYGASPSTGFQPSGEGLVGPSDQLSGPVAPIAQPIAVPVVATPRPQQQQPQAVRSAVVNGRRVNVVRRRPRPEAANSPRQTNAQPRAISAPVVPVSSDRFVGHPAQDIDLQTGSYSLFYSG